MAAKTPSSGTSSNPPARPATTVNRTSAARCRQVSAATLEGTAPTLAPSWPTLPGEGIAIDTRSGA
jgi:hypothetical protein